MEEIFKCLNSFIKVIGFLIFVSDNFCWIIDLVSWDIIMKKFESVVEGVVWFWEGFGIEDIVIFYVDCDIEFFEVFLLFVFDFFDGVNRMIVCLGKLNRNDESIFDLLFSELN